MQQPNSRGKAFRRKALALAIGAAALGFASAAYSQATNGTIYGQVPVASGETIQITGGAGFNRTVTVGPSGKYSVTLPVGTYTVSLLQNGKVVQTKTDVSPAAAGAVAVDFSSSSASGNAQTLATINVTASSIPPIDVTTTNQVTTITARQLRQLPLGRTAESIALLAPGVTAGSPGFGSGPLGTPFLVFGGASIAENAYYIDGMNSTDPLTNQGGISLPYGAIEQQQTLTSGYGAKYGRSIGGVISQVGKSGSNEWHFGARVSWDPGSLQSDYVNGYWNNPRYTGALAANPGLAYGQLYRYRKAQSASKSVDDAYVSGPIVKDKLFFFLGVEQDNSHYNNVSSAYNTFYTQHQPKIYAKLNWNINENNYLTLTAMQNSNKSWGTTYNFDYDTLKTADFDSLTQTAKNTFRAWVLNYTSYLTDNLTLHAMVGKSRGQYFTQQPAFPGYDPSLPHIGSASYQNPAFWPAGTPSSGIRNTQSSHTKADSSHADTVLNYRLSLDWKWRSHDFTIGIDNFNTHDIHDGVIGTGPGYGWYYGIGDPGTPIVGDDINSPPYAAPPNSNPDGAAGYYVDADTYATPASVWVVQRAQYIQDDWQVTPNLLLNLGLRNDQFINYNPSGAPYINLTKPQWAPRIGFSWDVFGDASMKVFGNAGRYYLSLPAGVALREAGAPIYTHKYYTYSGIDPATGVPTGLTPIPQNPSDALSVNNEYGNPIDPRAVAATNIKAEYSDNFVLGMQKQFHFKGVPLVFGATGIYQKLGRIIDDWDDQAATCAAGVRQGYSWLTPDVCGLYTQGQVLINPGLTQTLMVGTPTGGLVPVTVDMADQQWDRKPTRKYYAINLSLTHEWDNKWFGTIVYTFSKLYGNTEGPVNSAIDQGGSSVAATTQWDYASLMAGSYGEQFNSQRHQLKIYGAYALTPEWTVGANVSIASGHPKICLGYYGAGETNPTGYGSYYHFCGGKVAPPGSTGFTPWTHTLDMNVTYRPDWARRRLSFNLAVFNVLNSQTPLQYSPYYGTTDTPDAGFDQVIAWNAPRSARFTVSYDW